MGWGLGTITDEKIKDIIDFLRYLADGQLGHWMAIEIPLSLTGINPRAILAVLHRMLVFLCYIISNGKLH